MTADITSKALTIGAPSVTLSKVYDRTTTASVTAGALGGVVSGDVVSVTASASYATASVGTGKTLTVTYALGGVDAGNYTGPTSQTLATGVITAKGLGVSGLAATSREYDGTTSVTVTGTPVLTGVVEGDDVAVTGTATGLFADKNVGVGKPVAVSGLVLGGTEAANYALGTAALTADVTAKGLRVIANDQQKSYDGLVFTGYTVRWDGFVAGEGEVLVEGSVGFGGDAVSAVAVGAYTIVPVTSGVTVPNYILEAVNGRLDIVASLLGSRLVGRAGGVGLQRVTDPTGRFVVTATVGESVVGEASAGSAWGVRAGFWQAVEEGFYGAAGTAALGGQADGVAGVAAGVGDGVNSPPVRRLQFGLEAGNRLALPSVGEVTGVLAAASVGVVPVATLRVVGPMGDGWLRFEARGGAGGRWLVQATTDLGQGEWRTVSWIDLDSAGLGWIEVEPASVDALVLLRLVWRGP
ncbi:MAG: YDG domain-containing protein [Verrucomicrobiota bacterium]